MVLLISVHSTKLLLFTSIIKKRQANRFRLWTIFFHPNTNYMRLNRTRSSKNYGKYVSVCVFYQHWLRKQNACLPFSIQLWAFHVLISARIDFCSWFFDLEWIGTASQCAMGTSEYEKGKQIQSHQTEEKQTWKYLLGVGHIHEHEKSERIFHMYEYIVSRFYFPPVLSFHIFLVWR